ncbi:O-acetylserine/cysteine efflux transporter [Pseudomonas duriflava]|uniref:O-acetylserine/cysteine efflux transporter n=1 Tax=Pseudomonas duriflava TaxID=459528 RepID=A0A562Q7W9_9PSED|nr:EamA family transporter [Pseudomonas duriflava]TWI52829.1 O-acetylserine/cysteine efflux transporter [Pseudomonas duriflava]
MSPKDLLLALVVIVAWGLNFVVIKVGLHGVPPMLLGGLRFTLAALPAVFLIRRPALPWRWLLAYGLTISLGQFAFLFSAMYVGMPAGLASLVLQAQAFFTLLMAVLFLGERFRLANMVGLLIAGGGLLLIGLHGEGRMTLAGFLLTLCAAGMWGLGNIVTKRIGKVDMLALVVWGSLIPPIPFFMLSYWLEGPEQIMGALEHLSLSSMFAIIYLAFVATLLGYGLWSRLLSRYPASQVAPFSLLVPLVGITSAAVLADEHLTVIQIMGTTLVMAGLIVNVFGGWLFKRLGTLT